MKRNMWLVFCCDCFGDNALTYLFPCTFLILFDLVFACSLPALETSLDMARMKLDKAKLDEVTEHEEAEAAMKVTETYCDEMVVYSGDQTIAQHGLEDIANTKTDLWSDHNETIEQLKHEKKNEIIRKVQLAQLEVELHQKLKYLNIGCPSIVQNLGSDALPSTTVEGKTDFHTSQRCTECGGVARKGLDYMNEVPSRMYCAWKNVKCYEIEFLTGKCSPPEGYPSKCYRSNLLDPDVVAAVSAFQDSKQVGDKKDGIVAEKVFRKIQNITEKQQEQQEQQEEAQEVQEVQKETIDPQKDERITTGAKVGTMALWKEVEKKSEYVGKHFVPKIKKMLKEGENQQKQLYGEAQDREAKKLIDSGVELTRLPSKKL